MSEVLQFIGIMTPAFLIGCVIDHANFGGNTFKKIYWHFRDVENRKAWALFVVAIILFIIF